MVVSHLTIVTNQDIELNSFSKFTKVAQVNPLYEKEKRYKIKNYGPVSILMLFQKYRKLIYTTV